MTSLGFRRNLDGYWDASLDLQRQVIARTEAELARHRDLDAASTPDELRAHQHRVSEAVAAGVGGLVPLPPDPPDATQRGTFATAEYTVERLVYDSLPQVPVPALLYRPHPMPDGGAPAVLFVCGHAQLAKAEPQYQQVCASLAAAGFVVLAIDPWGQGERLGYLDPEGRPVVPGGTAEHTYAGLQAWAWGESVARYFVHDARRGIDLLAALPEVDEMRIGVTGNSGGGILCTLLAAVEPRLAAAAIGTFVTSRGAYLRSGKHQDAEQVLLGGTAGVDHADLLVAMAPRPVVVLAADYDFFPIEGTLASVDRARRAYDVLGAADALELVSAPVTHRYAPELAAAAVDFFTRALGGAGAGVGVAGVGLGAETDADHTIGHPVFSPEELRCTSSGQVALDDPVARFVPDLVRDRSRAADGPGAPSAPGTLGAPENGGTGPCAPEDGGTAAAASAGSAAAEWLRARVLAHRRQAAPRTRWLPGPQGSRHGLWRSEEDLWGAGVLLQPAAGTRPAAPGAAVTVHLMLLPEGTSTLTATTAAALTTEAAVQPADVVLVLDVRGNGALAPHDKDDLPPTAQASAVYKLLCDLLWLDDSLAAARLHDVRTAVDLLLTDPLLTGEVPGLHPDTPVQVHGHGAGGYAAMAAGILDERVRQVHTYGEDSVQVMLTERDYDRGDGAWQWLIPGMAHHASPAALAAALGDRLHRH